MRPLDGHQVSDTNSDIAAPNNVWVQAAGAKLIPGNLPPRANGPMTVGLQISFATAALCCCLLTAAAKAQQQKPEDPEDEKQIGLWLDQGISTALSANKSLDVEFHERFDEGASNLYEYFVQGGVAFRLRPWFTLIPIYRYQRFPGNPAHRLRKPIAAQSHPEHIPGPVEADPSHAHRGTFS